MSIMDFLHWVASFQEPVQDMVRSWFDFEKYIVAVMFIYTVGYCAGRVERHVNR